MVTVDELDKQIKEASHTRDKGWQHKVEMLKTCQLYLATNPSPTFIEKEYFRVSKCIMRREALFDTTYNHNKKNLSNTLYQALKKEHDEKYGTNTLRFQLKALSLLLNK